MTGNPGGARLADVGRTLLEIPESVALRVGSSELFVYSPGSLAELGLLLAELREEDCGHSWRTLLVELEDTDPEALASAVLEQVERGRPTTLFTYSIKNRDGESMPVAVATVSRVVASGFPYSGFPVLARCFIRASFRGMGLYPTLVHHRMECCHVHYGEGLQAFHIGAVREPVLSTLERGVGLEPEFIYVGDEILSVAGDTYRVRDFIAPMPGFRSALLDSEEPLRSLLSRFLEQDAVVESVAGIRDLVRREEVVVSEPVRQLVALLDAIGVIE